MPLINQLISLDSNSPISFSIVKDSPIDKHWHHEYELIYVLEGTLHIIVNGANNILNTGDMLLINPFEIHDTKPNASVLALISLDPNKINSSFNNNFPYFHCNSTTTETKEGFDQLMKIIANLIQASNHKGKYTYMYFYSLAYSLLHSLTTHFLMEDVVAPDNKQFSRMDEILKYIGENFNAGITLQKLADEFFLTVPYLSKLFRKYIGITFLEYLNDIRLKHSTIDLKTTSLSIDDIALNNGFPNTRSFTLSFKREFTMLPSEYRKKLKTSSEEKTISDTPMVALEHSHYLNIFSKYLTKDINTISSEPSTKMHIVNIPPISVLDKGTALKHKFKNMISIGRTKHLLIAENQSTLRDIQKKVRFKYLMSPGILDDDMMVYTEDLNGNPKYNFTYINASFDFLLSIGLKPFVLLCYMPKALAKKTDIKMYSNESIISPPKDMKKWTCLIQALILNLVTRYGMEEVKSWPISLWNKPESPAHLFGFENPNDFFDLYSSTYITVKSIVPDIRFGTPSLLPSTLTTKKWLKNFWSFCVENQCEPDFINFNFFASIISFKEGNELIERPHIKYNKEPDTLQIMIKLINQNLKSLGLGSKKLYMTEWNSTLSHRDLLNDTCFKASYLTKNILENYDELSSFCYWALSDANEQLVLPNYIFHGGIGLVTSNGIKKAPYHALCMLAKLGDRCIDRGDGYFITKKNNTYQVIIYNYLHYSDLYADGELFDMTFTNRYTPFSNQMPKRFNIILKDLPYVNYVKKDTILNREYGSSFDNWIDMGNEHTQTNEDIDYIKSISLPKIIKEIISTENGDLNITATLTPHEVRLITLTVSYN